MVSDYIVYCSEHASSPTSICFASRNREIERGGKDMKEPCIVESAVIDLEAVEAIQYYKVDVDSGGNRLTLKEFDALPVAKKGVEVYLHNSRLFLTHVSALDFVIQFRIHLKC